MAHTALARRYRPRRFGEVATQEHVSETLRRAVAGERVGHAYLFCGPRGVGKTTLARVLAMALNCPERTGRAAGARSGDRPPDGSGASSAPATPADPPPGEPCGECESCRRIWAGTTALDVVEIDAASNRGVDDARELRSRAMYAPSEEGRYKVYIVDEAHMLTREAWNALLKVLEEPPARVIFIFATTEPEKIEQTAAPILSRCQRFDFRRVAVPEIVSRLGEVLGREGLQAPEDALRLIARKADGGMRDALSLTDQVLALSDGSAVTVDTVRRILGVVEEERFLETMDLLAARDRAGLFRLVEELLDEGYDLVEFYHGLVEALRTLLRLAVAGETPDLPPEHAEEWRERASRFSPADLIRMLGMATEVETGGSLRRSSQPRVLLELLLLRYSYLDRTVEMESLLRALGGEAAGPGGTDAGGGGPDGPSGGGGARPRASGPSAAHAQGTTPEARSETLVQSAPTERPPPPAGEAAGATSPAERGRPRGSLLQGWRALLESGEGIPPGLTPFLIGADVSADAGSGALDLRIPSGPALERLGHPEVVEALERALTPFTGGASPPRIRVVEGGEPQARDPAGRISQGEVRAGKLEDLLAKEPGLRAAVEAWDLEIVD